MKQSETLQQLEGQPLLFGKHWLMSGNKHARHMALWYSAGEWFGAGLLSCMYAACTICMRAGDYVTSLTHLALSNLSH